MKLLMMLVLLTASLLAQQGGVQPVPEAIQIWHWIYNDCELNIPPAAPRGCLTNNVAIVVYSNSTRATHFSVTISLRRQGLGNDAATIERLVEAQPHCRDCRSALIISRLPVESEVTSINVKALTVSVLGEKHIEIK